MFVIIIWENRVIIETKRQICIIGAKGKDNYQSIRHYKKSVHLRRQKEMFFVREMIRKVGIIVQSLSLLPVLRPVPNNSCKLNSALSHSMSYNGIQCKSFANDYRRCALTKVVFCSFAWRTEVMTKRQKPRQCRVDTIKSSPELFYTDLGRKYRLHFEVIMSWRHVMCRSFHLMRYKSSGRTQWMREKMRTEIISFSTDCYRMVSFSLS